MKFQGLIPFLLCICSLCSATTSITFSVESTIESPKQTARQEENKLTVLLGESKIEERYSQRIRIHDFEQNLVFTNSNASNEFTRTSLFADIGFRVYEFQNRLRLGSALAAGNIEDNPMQIPLSEHIFSLRADNSPPLKRTVNDEIITFYHQDKNLFSYTLKGTPIDAESAKRFVLFLRYRYGIHPDVLEELEASNMIPDGITIRRHNIEVESFTLSTQKVAYTSDHDFSDITSTTPPSGSPILELCSIVQSKTSKDYYTYCQDLLANAVKEAKAENDLESVCLFLGYTLATGKPLPEEFLLYRNKFTRDPPTKTLFASINPKNQQAAEKALVDLNKLLLKTKRGRSIILIFRSNIQHSLQKVPEAIADLYETLTVEPMIVGAWKDLGDLYYKSYEPQNAWACWTTGRALNSKHHLLAEVAKFESKLKSENPEFFLNIPQTKTDDQH